MRGGARIPNVGKEDALGHQIAGQMGDISQASVEKAVGAAYSAASYDDDLALVIPRSTVGLTGEGTLAHTGPLVHQQDCRRLEEIAPRGIHRTSPHIVCSERSAAVRSRSPTAPV